MTRLFAGFDGGGTKTACALSDETGTVLGRGVGGPSNFLYCGEETARRSVRDSVRTAFEAARMEPREIEVSYMASAAIPTYDGARFEPFFASCVDTKTMLCEGDIAPIRFAAVRNKPAAVEICGTGSITYVFRDDDFVRVGGWGPTLGDEGSGYDIGRNAMQKTLRMCDGREEKDEEFADAVLRTIGVPEARLMVKAIREGDERSKVASVTKTVCDLWKAGNRTAEELLNAAADEICLAVNTALRRMGLTEKAPLVLSGSLVKEGRPLYRLISERVEEMKGVSGILPAKTEPEIASLALALRHGGCEEASERVLGKE